MKEQGYKSTKADLTTLGINSWKKAFWNLGPDELIQETLLKKQGTLSSNGTLVIKTGKFTGRSPKDRYIVEDDLTRSTVDWNEINQTFDKDNYFILKEKVIQYLNGKDLYLKDAAICNDKAYQLKVRLVAEYPWSAHFVHNMFVRLSKEELTDYEPEWTILCAPGFHADPAVDGTQASNFSIINFSDKTILIGGSGYTGEIKKGVFSILNYYLPTQEKVLSMHCSANVGKDNESAIFFGLSGTGKTTLSADPERQLLGDDEHGWSDTGLFNFEGGCYAKCIGLKEENEPDIFNAIRPGAILENIVFHPGTSRPDYLDTSITQNTRVSYPIHHIKNHFKGSTAAHPKNIFFLTCDAFGILPPLSKLTTEQAMYYFISGYTAKVAGTEEGVLEPKATFSACFGAPFLPLHPNQYAELLGQKINEHKVNIWLVNTGWTSGPYGTGHRISLKHTRTLISSVLNGEMNKAVYQTMPIFGLKMPQACAGVPAEILDPRQSWANKEAYDESCQSLAQMFNDNFSQFSDKVTPEIQAAAPDMAAVMTD